MNLVSRWRVLTRLRLEAGLWDIVIEGDAITALPRPAASHESANAR